MHRLDRGQILGKDGLQASAALGHVPLDPADQADVGVSVDEDLDVHLGTQGLILKDQDAFHQNHLARLDPGGLLAAGIGGIVVDGAIDCLARLEHLQMLEHHFRIKGVRMVVVDLLPLLNAQLLIGTVIVVMAEYRHIVPEAGNQIFHQGRLTAAGTACNANDNDI